MVTYTKNRYRRGICSFFVTQTRQAELHFVQAEFAGGNAEVLVLSKIIVCGLEWVSGRWGFWERILTE